MKWVVVKIIVTTDHESLLESLLSKKLDSKQKKSKPIISSIIWDENAGDTRWNLRSKLREIGVQAYSK